MNHPVVWRLLIGLASFHLLLLPAVHFVPVWIGGQDALYAYWSRIAHASLLSAQYELLVVFWAISPWNWTRRTILFITGLVVLTCLQVAIMFSLTKVRDQPADLLGSLLLNTVDVFVGAALVLAVLLELLRPFWGTLRQQPTEATEPMTIVALLRSTALAVVAVAVLKFSGGFFDDVVGLSVAFLIDAVLLMSCVWMTFAQRHVWVGIAGCVAAAIGRCLLAPAHVVATYGTWYWLPQIGIHALWVCSTLLIVRWCGFRLR